MLRFDSWHRYHSESSVEFLGLHPHTLRRYAKVGKIKSINNEAKQRLYDVHSYQRRAIGVSLVC